MISGVLQSFLSFLQRNISGSEVTLSPGTKKVAKVASVTSRESTERTKKIIDFEPIAKRVKRRRANMINILPKELLIYISTFMDSKLLHTLSFVDKKMHTTINTTKVFQEKMFLELALSCYKNTEPKNYDLLVKIIRAHIQTGDFLQAKEIIAYGEAQDILKKDALCSKYDLLREIAKGQKIRGDANGALETVAFAKKDLLQDGLKTVDQVKALIGIAKTEKELGEPLLAKETLAVDEETLYKVLNDPTVAIEVVSQVMHKFLEVQIEVDSDGAKKLAMLLQRSMALINNDYQRFRATIELAKAQRTVGSVQEAKKSLVQIRDEALRMDIEPIGTLINILKVQKKLGDSFEEEKTLTQIKEILARRKKAQENVDGNIEPRELYGIMMSLLEIILHQMELCDIDAARDTLDRLLDRLKYAATLGTSDLTILLKAAELHKTFGCIDKVLDIVDRVEKIAVEDDVSGDFSRLETLLEIANIRARIGDIKGVEETLHRGDKIDSRNGYVTFDYNGVISLVKMLLEKNAPAAARKIMLGRVERHRLPGLEAIARMQGEKGDFSEARETLDVAREFLSKEAYKRFKELTRRATIQATIGDIEEGRKTSDEAKEIMSSDFDADTLGVFAEAQVDLGDIDGARETVSFIKRNSESIKKHPERYIPYKPLLKIAKALVEEGRSGEGRNVLFNLRDNGKWNYNQQIAELAVELVDLIEGSQKYV